jgi:hypothetical protein
MRDCLTSLVIVVHSRILDDTRRTKRARVVAILIKLFDALDKEEIIDGDQGLRSALAYDEQEDWNDVTRQQDTSEALTRVFDKLDTDLKELKKAEQTKVE